MQCAVMRQQQWQVSVSVRSSNIVHRHVRALESLAVSYLALSLLSAAMVVWWLALTTCACPGCSMWPGLAASHAASCLRVSPCLLMHFPNSCVCQNMCDACLAQVITNNGATPFFAIGDLGAQVDRRQVSLSSQVRSRSNEVGRLPAHIQWKSDDLPSCTLQCFEWGCESWTRVHLPGLCMVRSILRRYVSRAKGAAQLDMSGKQPRCMKPRSCLVLCTSLHQHAPPPSASSPFQATDKPTNKPHHHQANGKHEHASHVWTRTQLHVPRLDGAPTATFCFILL